MNPLNEVNPLIILPVVHNETAVKCIDSLGTIVQLNNLLIVDNSEEKFTKNWQMADEILHITRPEGNIGVARAWNLGVQEVLNGGFDFLIILSASVVFRDGAYGLFKELAKNKNELGLMTQEGWHCIAIHRKVFEQIGDFDTNFYPAYYEDSDFIRRMEVAKIHEPCGDIHFKGMTIDVEPVEVAHGMKKANIKVNMQACADYFKRKWGDYPSYASKADRDKLYKHPFNNPKFDLKYYQDRSIEELKLLYKLP